MSGSKTFGKSLFNVCSLIIGFMCVLMYIITLTVSGSPYDMIHKLDLNKMIPPMWVWRIFSIVWFFLSGAAAGLIVYEGACHRIGADGKLCAYRGGTYFISGFFLSIVHYPLFFCVERLFIAFIVSLLAIICTVICCVIWSKISPLASVVLSGYAFWLLYVVFISACLMIVN